MNPKSPAEDGPEEERTKGKIIVAANSSWNIVNFRTGLIKALQAEGYEVFVVTPAEVGSHQRMELLGVDHASVPVSRAGLNPVEDAYLALHYVRLLRRIRPVAFLSFTIKPNIYGALAARLTGVPAIVNITGLGRPLELGAC